MSSCRGRDRSSRKRGFWFDKAAADRACRFFEQRLAHVKGEWAGQPFVLTKWQREKIVRPLFGWKRPDGLRRYRRVYLEVPRKNGKSTLAGGIALYLLFADGEEGAEIYSAAAARDQAGIVFEPARAMVEHSPKLRSRAEIYRRSIVFPDLGASYKVLSADAPSKHGLNAHGVIFDELHAQPNRDLWDVLVTSTGARRQPVIVAITTAGFDRNSICWEQHDYALKVLDGTIDDPSFLPVIYAAGEQDDWGDPKVWAKANPSLGISVKRDYLEAEYRRAKETPAYQNTFRRLHLCQWTEQAVRWMPMEKWDACAAPVAREALTGAECYAGLDLASISDIAAWVLAFPYDDGSFDVLCRFFIPRENLIRRVKKDRVPYDAWLREGVVEATEGDVIDYDVIRQRIHEDGEEFNIRGIAIDRWNSAQITTQLQGDGFTIEPWGQGWKSMSSPTKELEKLVLSRKLHHGGNPALRWMASNVAVRQDPAGNLKPDKEHSYEKIDGIVALVMALGLAFIEPEEEESVYEHRGVLVL